MAAVTPAACPVTVHAIMYRILLCDTLSPAIHRPATNKLSTVWGIKHPNGTWKYSHWILS
jgi:hypothetical protein